MVEMTQDQHDSLMHIGVLRRSGRYPWGSGSDPYQNAKNFQAYMTEMKSKGMTEKQIAEMLSNYAPENGHISTTALRDHVSMTTEQIREANISRAMNLSDRGLSNVAIAKTMGLGEKGESTVRGWLKAGAVPRDKSIRATANVLKDLVDSDKPFLDVGKGNELHLGVSEVKLRTALAMLDSEGYGVHPFKMPQQGVEGQMTNYRVLTRPGVTWNEAGQAVRDGKLSVISAQSDDGGQTFRVAASKPVSLNSKRLEIRYGDDVVDAKTGVLGKHMDGVIELRRNVPEFDLGANRYAQVRVAVDDKHFLKGMAMYADDLPAGKDMRFNTSKKRSEVDDIYGVMKPLKVDKDGNLETNPFGSSTFPHTYKGKDGKTHTSALNIVGYRVGDKLIGNIEGRWDTWSNALSSQMLSKQSLSLAQKQLGEAAKRKQDDLDKILRMNNPVVQRKLLKEFADSADSDSAHLKGAAMKGQSTHVILPMNSMKPKEIYAPNFENGTKVVLIRHPHAGPFEIPELTVNNNNRVAQRILKGATDAVGIHHKAAEQLSGADFDGDTVLVIPNNRRLVRSRSPLKELENFDPRERYKIPDDDTKTTRMTKANTQMEMGKISNLITDMSIHGAPDHEIARAVRHSMVVIDAEKHGLDYKRSALENNITALKTTYQGGPRKGASTIISRANAEQRVDHVRLRKYSESKDGPIDPKTGELVYVKTGRLNKDGSPRQSKFPAMLRTKEGTTRDARKLMSDNPQPMEELYASHGNALKEMANRARREMVSLSMPKANPAAKAVYRDATTSLTTKLHEAQRNAPFERRAQVLAGHMYRDKLDSNPDMDKDQQKKARYQSLTDARMITGAKKQKIYITDREWEAIQAGALHHSKLSEILTHADMERVAELASPKRRTSLTPGQLGRARAMKAMGRSMSEIARELGIPRTTLTDNLEA